MEYSTYVSAAEKFKSFGQVQLSVRTMEHAHEMERKKIADLDFDILVGKTREFKGARFSEFRLLREKESNTIMIIFESSSNTHRINATIKSDGTLVWHDGNLFLNRKSVKSLERLVSHIANYRRDLQKLLKEMGLSTSDLKISTRTFYI
jgi:hypothetical protein